MALPDRVDLENWSVGKTIKDNEFSGTGFVHYLHKLSGSYFNSPEHGIFNTPSPILHHSLCHSNCSRLNSLWDNQSGALWAHSFTNITEYGLVCQ